MIKKILLLTLGLLSCLLIIQLHVKSVNALSQTFLDPTTIVGSNTSAVTLDVEDTSSVSVPSIALKIFIPKTNFKSQTITLTGFCAGVRAYAEPKYYDASSGTWVGTYGIFGNFSIPVPAISDACGGGPDLVISNIPNDDFKDQTRWAGGPSLYINYKVMLLRITLFNGTGPGNTKKFSAFANDPQALTTQAEVDEATNKSLNQPNQADAFAILGSNNYSYGYDVTFKFSPNCSADTFTQVPDTTDGTFSNGALTGNNFYLHWRDADANVNYGSGTYWQLVDDLGGIQNGPAAGSAAMGYSNEHKAWAVNLQHDRTYSWVWHNVNHLNTLHIWMPYSEINQGVTCPTTLSQPPQGNLEQVDCNIIKGWAFDADYSTSNVMIRTAVNGIQQFPDQQANIPRGDVNAAYPGLPGDHGFNFATPAAAVSTSAATIDVFAIGIGSWFGQPDGSDLYLGRRIIPPCLSIIVDVCPNIPGIQATVPPGNYKDGSGNCVFDAPTCTFASMSNNTATTYPNSQFTMFITMRNDGTSTWVPGTFNLGSALTQTNNYLTDGGGGEVRANWPNNNPVGPGGSVTFSYTAVVPGFGATYASYWKFVHEFPSTGYGWEGSQCGFNVTIEQGRFGDAFNWAAAASGSVFTCSEGTISTGVGGNYTFAIPEGWGFCLDPTSAQAPDSIWVEPYDHGYRTGGTNCAPGTYCTAVGSYECILAGVTPPWVGCGTSNEGRYRTLDGAFERYDKGFDFALGWKPVVSCVMSSSGVIGTGPYTPGVTVSTSASAGPSPSPIAGTGTYSAAGQTINGTYANLTTISPKSVSFSPSTINIPSSGTYPQTASVGWTAGPYNSGGNTVPCSGQANLQVAFEPYLKAYGGDVWAGGSFAASCGSSGGIFAYAGLNGAGKYIGSSGQFGVTALMNINGFYSSSVRTVANQPPKDTTFSNVTGVPNSDTTYGGGYGGSGICMPDYYATTQNAPVSKPNLNAAVSSSPLGKSQYIITKVKGPPTITIPLGHQIAVYAVGDLYIDRNIVFDTAARATTDDIPAFVMIVKGNIYIDPGVTQLDGIYIAQPSVPATPTDGRIYTCAPDAGALYPAASLLASCSSQLVVNGALIAQQVKFLRTFKSLNDSTPAEIPNFADGTGTNAAEVINYTPEMYLAPSPLLDLSNPVGGSGYGKYQAIYGLPPVF
jgi:hypothetical protein